MWGLSILHFDVTEFKSGLNNNKKFDPWLRNLNRFVFTYPRNTLQYDSVWIRYKSEGLERALQWIIYKNYTNALWFRHLYDSKDKESNWDIKLEV